MTYCIAQGTLLNILWLPIQENNLKKNGYMYMYNWITLKNKIKLKQVCNLGCNALEYF